jgi:hypothetical protein
VIVFGDRVRVRSAAAQMERMRAALARAATRPAGPECHAAVVALLLAAGELAQGVADAAFARDGCDGLDPAGAAAMQAAVTIARAVWWSHWSGYRTAPPLEALATALDALDRLPLPASLTLRAAEGFQHYAVYPEAYALAAVEAFGDDAPPLVVGVRTIGATLAAAVSGALGGGPPLTVRPIGPPFQRRLALGPDAAGALAAARGRKVAVVDEGPGLSGSSFGAVLDALDAAGVPEGDARVFPSHEGDVGGAAMPRTRARWRRVSRAHVGFEAAFLDPRRPGLALWVRDLIGPLEAPPRDVGAGRWRAQLWPEPRGWPPVIATRERRKFLLRARGEEILARFAGLGEPGEAAAARADRLAAAGFSPALLGHRHGFAIGRWAAGARPLPAAAGAVPRARLVDRVAAYLAFRAEQFPADPTRGAPPAGLLQVARANLAEAGAAAALRRLDRFDPWVEALERAARPIEVDARLHAWEWLVLPDGRLWKTDAVDHCDGHDPIGCQDLAWDVAGAIVELDLDAGEAAALRRALAARGHAIEPEPLAFYQAMYLSFQLGLHAAGAANAADGAERARLAAAAGRYRRGLERDAARPDAGAPAAAP